MALLSSERSMAEEFDDVSDASIVSVLTERLAPLVSQPNSSATIQTRLTFLQLIRKRHLREPLLVIEHGTALIAEYKAQQARPALARYLSSFFSSAVTLLTRDIWSVYEQVCVAAIDAALPVLRNECIMALEHRFSSSARVASLRALVYDSADRWTEAAQWYDRSARRDATAMAARRRRAAHLRMQGRFSDAVAALSAHVSLYGEDAAAWSELADLYIMAHALPEAKTSLEELLLLRPEAWTTHIRYADVLYSLGGAGNVAAALAYYATALELRPGASRAAMGLVLCVRALGEDREAHYPRLNALATGLSAAAAETLVAAVAADAAMGAQIPAAALQPQQPPVAGAAFAVAAAPPSPAHKSAAGKTGTAAAAAAVAKKTGTPAKPAHSTASVNGTPAKSPAPPATAPPSVTAAAAAAAAAKSPAKALPIVSDSEDESGPESDGVAASAGPEDELRARGKAACAADDID